MKRVKTIKKGTAIVAKKNTVLSEAKKRARAKEFGRLLREGAFDYPLTNDEIEAGKI